ncbi:hypothetical protein KBB12_02575 [Candidatus Woesebacteria bacterium]|nr:hypothetical protein [Candidatus Woesebacteria bacterium]
MHNSVDVFAGAPTPLGSIIHSMVDEEIQEGPLTARQPISWQAHEYVHVEKTPDWYWALGLIAIAGAVVALMYENILFALLILILAFVLALFAARQPNVIHFSLTQRGVRIEEELYPYNALESFAVHELSPNHAPKLILKPKKFLAPVIVIPIEDVDADDVHDFMLAFLEEDEHTEPTIHHVMEWLGF